MAAKKHRVIDVAEKRRRPITTRIDGDVWELVDFLADVFGRSLNLITNEALFDWLKKNDAYLTASQKARLKTYSRKRLYGE